MSIVWLVRFITTTVDYIGVWWYFDKQQRTFNRLLLAVFLTSSVYYNYCGLHWYLWWYFAGNGEGGCGAEDEHSFLALTVDWRPHTGHSIPRITCLVIQRVSGLLISTVHVLFLLNVFLFTFSLVIHVIFVKIFSNRKKSSILGKNPS